MSDSGPDRPESVVTKPVKPALRNGTNGNGVPSDSELRNRVRDLLSADPTVRKNSLAVLSKHIDAAAEALIAELRKKTTPPEDLDTITDALAELGRPAVDVVLQTLKTIEKVERLEDVYAIFHLVDALEEIDDDRVAPELVALVKKLNAFIRAADDPSAQDAGECTKVEIHRVLSGFGAAGALDDLLSTLGNGKRRVRSGVTEAVAAIGDRRALLPLLKLYMLEAPVSSSGAHEIKHAFREIVRRIGGGPDDEAVKKLNDDERATLERLMPSGRSTGPAGPGKHGGK